jgi:tetratricopeptide (TPR) repeat protein
MSSVISQAIDYARQGKTSEAYQLAETNLANYPNDAETWHLLGLLDNITGSLATAIERFERAITLNPNVAKYHSNYGNALLKTNQLADAEREYRRALELEPDFQSAAFNLASLLNTQRKNAEGLAVLAHFKNINDPSGDTDSLLGLLYQNTKHEDKALAHFQTAAKLNPEKAEFWAQLAALLELMNRVDEAWKNAERGLALAPNLPEIREIKARLLRREKRYDEAIQAISELNLDSLTDVLASRILNEWGTNLDRLGYTADAMNKFIAAKQYQARDLPDITQDAEHYLSCLDNAQTLDYSQLAGQTASNTEPEPVFLIAFPRSGTTLLDQILDSHPAIQTLEEKPLIITLVEAHPEIFDTADTCIQPLTPVLRQHLQQLYFDLVSRHLTILPGNILVDKLPLNITRVHHILQIFPRARFILALRHSCDVVLSCQMHLFKPNAAMAHLQTLESTAQMYAKVMQLWQKFNQDLQPSHYVVRYENLVGGRFEEEISGLLQYLDLPWDEGLRQHTEHAKNRGRINTPSYHQVAEPLYTRAAGRWEGYRNELAPVLPILEPAMRYLGYSASAD